MEIQSNSCVGNQLRLIRQAKRLSLEDVAGQLRLKKELIEDIERGDYHKIPTTYLKGYLRSYAKLVSMSDSEMALSTLELAENNASLSNWKFFYSPKQISAGDKLIQWITYSIISILIILVTLWWKSDNLLNKSMSVNESLPGQTHYAMAESNIIEVKK